MVYFLWCCEYRLREKLAASACPFCPFPWRQNLGIREHSLFSGIITSQNDRIRQIQENKKVGPLLLLHGRSAWLFYFLGHYWIMWHLDHLAHMVPGSGDNQMVPFFSLTECIFSMFFLTDIVPSSSRWFQVQRQIVPGDSRCSTKFFQVVPGNARWFQVYCHAWQSQMELILCLIILPSGPWSRSSERTC